MTLSILETMNEIVRNKHFQNEIIHIIDQKKVYRVLLWIKYVNILNGRLLEIKVPLNKWNFSARKLCSSLPGLSFSYWKIGLHIVLYMRRIRTQVNWISSQSEKFFVLLNNQPQKKFLVAWFYANDWFCIVSEIFK